MMLSCRYFMVGVLCGIFLVATSAAAEVVIPQEKVILFDGENLEGFYTWLVDHHHADPNRVFSVVDQIDGAPAIRVSGEDWGGFATKQSYRDFRLVVEFRWGLLTWGNRKDATRDSGILLHCQGRDGNTSEDFNGPWMRSVETQIIEGGVADFILVGGFDAKGNRLSPSVNARVKKDRDQEWVYAADGELLELSRGRINWYGRDPDWEDTLGFRGREDVESPYGEWTRIEVISRGSAITNIVNGKVVNVIEKSSFSEGKIMFQSEGAEVFFRRIELHPLD